MKETQQEVTIEGVEGILPSLATAAIEAVAKVVRVAVKEALALDEVDEHQAVEHDGGVPFLVALHGYPVNEAEEGGVFLFEHIVEALGNALDVEGGTDTAGHVRQRHLLFFFERYRYALKSLDKRLAGLRCVICELSYGVWLPGLSFHPLPDLS